MDQMHLLLISEDPELGRELERHLDEGTVLMRPDGADGTGEVDHEDPPLPDVVVVDCSTDLEQGLAVISKSRSLYPDIRVIALVRAADPEAFTRARRAGAFDTLSRTRSLDGLLASARMAYRARYRDYAIARTYADLGEMELVKGIIGSGGSGGSGGCWGVGPACLLPGSGVAQTEVALAGSSQGRLAALGEELVRRSVRVVERVDLALLVAGAAELSGDVVLLDAEHLHDVDTRTVARIRHGHPERVVIAIVGDCGARACSPEAVEHLDDILFRPVDYDDLVLRIQEYLLDYASGPSAGTELLAPRSAAEVARDSRH